MLIEKRKLADLGQALTKAYTRLDAENDYKFYKFTKALLKAFKEIAEEEKDLQERNGVLNEKGRFDPSREGIGAYIKEREMMLAEEMDLEVKHKFPYPVISAVCADNKLSQELKITLCDILLKEE
jgi:hypothetical protein